MKKRLVLVLLILVVSISTTGCFESLKNNMAKNGGVVSTAGDYVVINMSGGRIVDIWVLKDTFVDSENGSDGISFRDQYGNFVIVQGDCKVIRLKDREELKKYNEYHLEDEINN